MADEFKVEGFNLVKLFVEGDVFYQIPAYQRPYAWDEEQISELIDDLTESYHYNKDKQYFCGSLVLAKNKNDGRNDVIDGQQRLTTFTILACVIRDFYKEHLSAKNKAYIQRSICDEFEKHNHKLRFLTDGKYQATFENSVLRENALQEQLQDIKQAKQLKDNRYLQNAYYLKDELDKALEGRGIDIDDFVSWLYTKVILTRIECLDEDSAIRIFNVLNDRGMPLHPVDILKSSLMQKLDKERREAFKTRWQEIMSSLEQMGLSLYDTLQAYLYYAIASNPENRIDEELIKYFAKSKQDSIQIIEEIGKFANHYIDMMSAKDKYIYCLRYLRSQIYWRSILCSAKMESYKDYDELKKLLVAYYYQNLIGGATANRFKQLSFNIIKAIKNKESIDKIKNEMRNNLKDYKTTKSYQEMLVDEYAYNYKWVKPTLLMLEYFSRDDETFIEMDSDLHVEHILPQTPTKEWEQNFSKEDRERWTNALANLVLLKFKKNSQAKNKTYEEKCKIYINKDNVSTSIITTLNIANIKNNNKWDTEALEKRNEDIQAKIKEIIDIF